MPLREPSKKELKVIKNALRFFNSLDFLENCRVLINESRGKKEVYAVGRDLYHFLQNHLQNHEIECYAGIKIGEVGKRFRLSLEGAFWLVRTKKRKVWVNDRGEMLFLYGRDIFASSVVKAERFDQNEVVFVCNRSGDILGLGKSRFEAEKVRSVEEDRVVVENLVDRGQYIRKEKLYSSF
jgi:60S ribosome subunit biogenesis protein NIP7